MFCNNCGTEISDDDTFCWKCGTKTRSGQSSSHTDTQDEVVQPNTQITERSEQSAKEQQVATQETQGHKIKLYMKNWGVSFIIGGILILLILQITGYQITITLFDIIPIEKPIWGISLILLGIGLVAAGSIG